MAFLLAIEGADGVGKNSTATRLREELDAAGRSAALISFPRYESTVGGKTLGDYLAGKLDVPVAPRTAAVLYALYRLESRDTIAEAAASHDVVIFDRYIASNMAYQAGRLPAGDADALMAWILALETESFALPRPTLSIYLATPWELARELILKKRRRSYTDRSYDEYEADVALQRAVRANYEAMVADDLLGPWRIVRMSEAGAMRAPEAITAEIRSYL